MNPVETNPSTRPQAFRDGMRDGFPIGLGYFAVAFSLGIAAQHAGLTAFQGFLASLLTFASAGEYAAFVTIAANAPYLEMAIIILVTNARYMLMSCALSQRFSSKTPFLHRLLVGFYITDEVFGITIARPGYVQPFYTYGAMLSSLPLWAVGTSLGIIAGNILPLRVVSALSVALYGMFLAVIIPPGRTNKILLGLVVTSFAVSFAAEHLPWISGLSGGNRVILLTVVLAAAAAILFPLKEDKEETDIDA